MKRRLLAATTVALGLAIVAGRQLLQRDGSPAADPTEATPMPASPKPAETPVFDAAPAEPADREGGRDAAPDPAPPPAPPVRAAGPIERAALHAAQEKDPVWALPTETLILSQLSQSAGLAVSSVDVDCRLTLCRVQLIYPAGRRGNPAQLNTMLATPGLEPRIDFTLGNVGGLAATTAYLHRGDAASRSR